MHPGEQQCCVAAVLLACLVGHGGCCGTGSGDGIIGAGSSGRDSLCILADLGCHGWLDAGWAVGWAGHCTVIQG